MMHIFTGFYRKALGSQHTGTYFCTHFTEKETELREAKGLAQGPSAKERQGWAMSPHLPGSRPSAFSLSLWGGRDGLPSLR